jgi:hypothetical protein
MIYQRFFEEKPKKCINTLGTCTNLEQNVMKTRRSIMISTQVSASIFWDSYMNKMKAGDRKLRRNALSGTEGWVSINR